METEGDIVPVGTIVSTKTDSYRVTRSLYQGLFTDFYVVRSTKNERLAMQVARKSDHRQGERLQKVLNMMQSVKGKHFAEMVDRTKNASGKYICLVYELPGKRIHQIRNHMPGRVFSFATGMGVAIQCLEAIEDLHRAGYVHRDIKPHNFTIGQKGKTHSIYLVEFGLARKFRNFRNEIKPARRKLHFQGTVHFAPLSTHKGLECGRKDDCESWFYLVVALIVPGHLPWRRCFNVTEVAKMKEECRMDPKTSLLTSIKRNDELNKVLQYIDSVKYEERVDYDYIYEMIRRSCRIAGVDIDAPYDWEPFTLEKGQYMNNSATQ